MLRFINMVGTLGRLCLLCCLGGISGCVTIPQFPVFGAKPPVVTDEVHTPPAVSAPVDYRLRSDKQQVESETAIAALPKSVIKGKVLGSDKDRDGVSSNQEEEKSRGVVDAEFIVRRLTLYKGKMAGWNQLAGGMVTLDLGRAWPTGWYACVQRLEMVLAGYRRLSLWENQGGVEGALLFVYRRDIDYLESGCDEIMAVGQGNIKRTLVGFNGILLAQTQGLVQQYLDQGMNQEAAASYENFVNQYGKDAAGVELRKLYSIALRRQGSMTAALVPLAAIWSSEQQGPQGNMPGLGVGLTYADLLFANGQREAAHRIYEKLETGLAARRENDNWVKRQLRILDEDEVNLPLYAKLVNSYYRFDGRGVPANFSKDLSMINLQDGGPMADNIAIIKNRVVGEATRWIDGRLAKIDELIGGQEFEQAQSIVKELLALAGDSQYQDVLEAQERIKEAVVTARQSRQQLKKQHTEHLWRGAVDLFDRREYRAAIAAFGQLLHSGEYGDRAALKMSVAVNMEAVEMRRKAAGLFFKARKMVDPQEKRNLLLQSRNLLQKILDDYPQAEVVDKIRRNLQVIEAQLQRN